MVVSSYYLEITMATAEPPEEAVPPLCACGCGESVSWRPGKGWATWRRGHQNRGRASHRKGKTLPETHRENMSKAHKERWKGKRRRDHDPTGTGVYATHEYREARARLVEGKPCTKCGSTENIHAHHQVAGDDESLIPLCFRCHPKEHFSSPTTKGRQSPPGEKPPLCTCGCGQPVGWKRVRGWAKYRKGHGNAKVPAVAKLQEAPKCGCGCGESVAFRNGKGWNQYKRGHGQRVEGHYSQKRQAEKNH